MARVVEVKAVVAAVAVEMVAGGMVAVAVVVRLAKEAG